MISQNHKSISTGSKIRFSILIGLVFILLFSITIPGKAKTTPPKYDGKQMNIKKTGFAFKLNTADEDSVDFNVQYPGGYPAWLEFVRNNFNYPEEALIKNISGIIFVQFTVTEKGNVMNPNVIRGIDSACDKEALRVIGLMPKWKPLLKNGISLSFQYILPIKLKLAPISKDTTSNDIDEKPLLVVEQFPGFNGGDEAMKKYIADSIHYPENAIISKIEGTVFIQFVVSKRGKLSKPKIVRGISKECDEEAIRVVMGMPDWIPGRQNGQVVPVMFQIPVIFQLKNAKNPAKKEENPHQDVYQNPEFKGGYEGLKKYFSNNINYPIEARELGIQGKVIVQFVVEKTGKVSSVKILNGIGGGCDEEAIRIVKNMPDWLPGKINGETVPVKFETPVEFRFGQ